MADEIDTSSKEFLNAKEEMDSLVYESIKGKELKPNAMFAKKQ